MSSTVYCAKQSETIIFCIRIITHKLRIYTYLMLKLFSIEIYLVDICRNRGKILSEAAYCGKLTDLDLDLILQTLRESPVLTNKEKRRYGLL